MASAIYYDSIGSRSATLTDGTTTSGSFTSSDVLSNELRATDGNITDVIGGWAVDEGLQFNFGGTVSPNFCAIYSTEATSNDIIIQRDNSASGAFNGISNTISDVALGWNVRTLTVLPMQYWTINSSVGTLTGISEIFFGEKLAFPVEPTANITTEHNFGSEEIKALGARRYYFSKHDNYKTFTLSLDHMTSANKTSLETFANTVTDREPFIYSEDDTTGPFHWVRLVRPLTFRQVAPNIFSCQVVMRELTS